MNTWSEEYTPPVPRISVAKRMVIPPNSVAQMMGKIDQSMHHPNMPI